MTTVNPPGPADNSAFSDIPDDTIAYQVGKYMFLVDTADLELVRSYRWRAHRHPRTGKIYARGIAAGRAEIMRLGVTAK